MKSRMGIIAALCALLASPAGVQDASAQGSFYAGKTVTIVVGYKPGGGYDAIARLLARHLPKHIPGKPTIIIQNMPGAGSLIEEILSQPQDVVEEFGKYIKFGE